MKCFVESKCQGRNGDGHCTVYLDEGVEYRNDKKDCVFQNIRKEKKGTAKQRINPLKAAKRAQRAAAKA